MTSYNLASLVSSITQLFTAKILISIIEEIKVWGFHIYFHEVTFLCKSIRWMNEWMNGQTILCKIYITTFKYIHDFSKDTSTTQGIYIYITPKHKNWLLIIDYAWFADEIIGSLLRYLNIRILICIIEEIKVWGFQIFMK